MFRTWDILEKIDGWKSDMNLSKFKIYALKNSLTYDVKLK